MQRPLDFVTTPALTPALSPRRGRILCRGLSIRESHIIRLLYPANHQLTATGNSTSESSQRVRSLSPLPGGEGQGEGERHTNFSPKFVRGMMVRGIKTQPEAFCFNVPLTFIPLTTPLA
jgi:hypothetical protein